MVGLNACGKFRAISASGAQRIRADVDQGLPQETSVTRGCCSAEVKCAPGKNLLNVTFRQGRKSGPRQTSHLLCGLPGCKLFVDLVYVGCEIVHGVELQAFAQVDLV